VDLMYWCLFALQSREEPRFLLNAVRSGIHDASMVTPGESESRRSLGG
jgi:hypothetical protein